MMISLEDAKRWLRVDATQEDELIAELILLAEQYIINALDATPPDGDLHARLLCRTLVADWYDNREHIGNGTSERVRFTVQSLLRQLRYRNGGEECDKTAASGRVASPYRHSRGR